MIDIEGLRGAIDALCVRERRALTAGRPPIGDPPPDDDEDDEDDEEDEDERRSAACCAQEARG